MSPIPRRIVGRKYARIVAAASAIVFSSSISHGQSLGLANDYNAFVFGDITSSYSDTEGRVAAGGDVTYTGYGVGDKLNSATAGNSLVVGGDLYYHNGQVFNGNVVYGGTRDTGSFTVLNGSISQGSVIDFDTARRQLEDLSTMIAGSDVSGSYTNYYGTLQFVGTDAGLNTFVVQASDFNSANGIKIDAPTGSTVLINIAGTALDFRYLSIDFVNLNGDGSGATNKQNVLFNFYEATSLNITGIGVKGSVLAPLADVSFTNGHIDGTIVAKSLTGNGELHDYKFQGTLPVPEPTSVMLLGATTMLVLGVRRRARC